MDSRLHLWEDISSSEIGSRHFKSTRISSGIKTRRVVEIKFEDDMIKKARIQLFCPSGTLLAPSYVSS